MTGSIFQVEFLEKNKIVGSQKNATAGQGQEKHQNVEFLLNPNHNFAHSGELSDSLLALFQWKKQWYSCIR